ncbi:MAG TPA: aminopeptidase [Phycisphaerae bacterium]|nr:aminopeptidase [Phycisphaerales bacterium]HRX84947.1 aminopeptidase [Phycisphaerae bacterium]
MLDPRLTRLADVLVNYSTELKPGDKVLIEAIDVPDEIACELARVARQAGADPLVTIKHNAVLRALLMHGSDEQLQLIADTEALRMKNVQAYIGVRGTRNVTELSDVPDERMKAYQRIWWRPVHGDIRVRQTRWVVLRFPSDSMAQAANMSTEAFEDFYFNVCTMDYAKMSKAMQPLQKRMEAADKVKIVGPGTELAFSIKGIPAIGCDGKLNIPDGEVFTAPVRDSVNGTLQYNTPTVYNGIRFDDVRLEFKDGKIVKATSSNTEALNKTLDSDEGARYIGEFAIGFNPYVTQPMLDILFDEKIAGSFHFTPGAAYEDEADNGNRSQVHWDMVCRQDPAHGGGEIWFDGELIRKDGQFVPKELQGLNPENLK